MKLCYSTLGCTEKTLSQALQAAQTFGIQGLEIRGLGACLHNKDIEAFKPENATNTKSLLSTGSVRPIVLGTSCSFHTPQNRRNAEIEGRESIDIAADFAFPYIRVFGNNLTENREMCMQSVADGIADLCAYASDKQVAVLLEVHGDFNTVSALTPIVKALAPYPNFGLIWDIAHTHRPYGDNWGEFYTAMRPYIRHIHVKDYSNFENALTLPGKGDIPILPILRRLLADGYDGYFSLEWERQWHSHLPPIEVALEHFTALVHRLC